jgi:MerR family mercuric resistance operon transcriptional regulator
MDRVSIRKIAALRLEQIEAKLEDLTRMRMALSGLIEACHHTANADPCPIIQALATRQLTTSCRSPMRSSTR